MDSDWLCHSSQCLCFIVSGFYVQPEQTIPGLISNSGLMYYRLWSINGLWTGNWLRARLGKALRGVFWKRGYIGWSKFLFLILYPTHGSSQEDLPHGLRRGNFAQKPWKGWSPWEREISNSHHALRPSVLEVRQANKGDQDPYVDRGSLGLPDTF